MDVQLLMLLVLLSPVPILANGSEFMSKEEPLSWRELLKKDANGNGK